MSVTAKISGNALKHESRTQYYVNAVNICKTISLRECLDEHQSRKKVCGWDGGHPGLAA